MLHHDGALVDSVGGIGQLYAHVGDIGIGEVNDDTRLDDSPVTGPSVLGGTIEKLIQYNTALDTAGAAALDEAMANESLGFDLIL